MITSTTSHMTWGSPLAPEMSSSAARYLVRKLVSQSPQLMLMLPSLLPLLSPPVHPPFTITRT
jgi:hypothetical protein